jgi:hypothetical protein
MHIRPVAPAASEPVTLGKLEPCARRLGEPTLPSER